MAVSICLSLLVTLGAYEVVAGQPRAAARAIVAAIIGPFPLPCLGHPGGRRERGGSGGPVGEGRPEDMPPGEAGRAGAVDAGTELYLQQVTEEYGDLPIVDASRTYVFDPNEETDDEG